MIEFQGDIWQFRNPEDWLCVTTNGTVKSNGDLVMGKGIALEASQRFPGLRSVAGGFVRLNGLRVEVIRAGRLILFPTKYDWREQSNINLILRSTLQLVDAAISLKGGRILIPRPGCNNGQLDWKEVKPILEKYLTSDRFVIFSKPGES